MLVFIVAFRRCGGTILCDVLGQHSKLVPLNEHLFWKDRVKQGEDYVVHTVFEEVNLKTLTKNYPNAKFISINRNPLDIAASYKRLSILRGKKWTNEIGWLAKIKEYREFTATRKQYENRPNFLVIDFREMILYKIQTFQKIFKWLDLEFTQVVYDYISKYVSNMPVKNFPGLAFSASKGRKVDSYKDVLTPQEIRRIVK